PADGAVLLVASDDLDAPAVHLGEEREVPHNVEQIGRCQHPGGQQLLSGQLRHGLAELRCQLVARERKGIHPSSHADTDAPTGATSAGAPCGRRIATCCRARVMPTRSRRRAAARCASVSVSRKKLPWYCPST